MSSNTQKLIDRDIRAKQELRRATVLTEPRAFNFDPAFLDRTVFVVDVDLPGSPRPIRDVVVKSSTGSGGRAYAQVGKAVEIQRNAGGRWIVIGAADRITTVGKAQELDEATDSFGASAPTGFTSLRKPYGFYAANGVYGQAGYGNTLIVDGDGNEVNL